MRYISLFSGIGGFDKGFDDAGMECVLQVEQDKHCLNILNRHWPDVPKIGDVRDVTKSVGTVDLICGGFPCQDVSVAGRRQGLAGERSGLWHEFHRILSELSPRWVVIENVPGLFSSNEGRDFAVVLSGLEECGYHVAWRVLDSQHFGVPQRRRRVFLVGSLGTGACAQVLFERKSLSGNPATGGEKRAELAKDIAGCLDAGSATKDVSESGLAIPINTMAATRPESAEQNRQTMGVGEEGEHRFTLQENHGHAVFHENKSAHVSENDTARSQRSGASHSYQMVAGTVSARDAKGPGNFHNGSLQNTVVDPLRSGGDGIPPSPRTPGEVVVSHPLKSGGNDDHCPTHQTYIAATVQSGGNDGGFRTEPGEHLAVQGAVRRLTPTECERLQGFPDGWTAGQPDTQRYRQLGNAVTVNVARWIGRRIYEHHHHK